MLGKDNYLCQIGTWVHGGVEHACFKQKLCRNAYPAWALGQDNFLLALRPRAYGPWASGPGPNALRQTKKSALGPSALGLGFVSLPLGVGPRPPPSGKQKNPPSGLRPSGLDFLVYPWASGEQKVIFPSRPCGISTIPYAPVCENSHKNHRSSN